MRSDMLRRMHVVGRITRETSVVRMPEQEAEEHSRRNDAPIGRATIKKPKDVISWWNDSIGLIFPIDKLKTDAADETLELSVADDAIGQLVLKVLKLSLKGKQGKSMLFCRYWIDLERNGQVVRQEFYTRNKQLQSRLDIKLSKLKCGDVEVWMPVSGELVSYAAPINKQPVFTKEPIMRTTIYMVHGTLEFNKRPSQDVFKINYKPGTIVSDKLRKLTYEFGQQKVGPKPTKTEIAKMLIEQLSKAEEQKSELVVASPTQSFDWASWLIPWFSVAVVISLCALWVQRQRH